MAIIDTNRDEFGVEPICSVLQEASSICCAAKSGTPSARAIRDAVTAVTVMTVFRANYTVYGVHKIRKVLQGASEDIGRD